MTKVVILTGKCGDLCNRLFRFARFYCAKPPGVILVDITLFQFAYLFTPKPILWRIFFLILRFFDNNRFSLLVRFLNWLPCTEKINPPEYDPSDGRYPLERLYESLLGSKKRIILVEENTYYPESSQSPKSIASLRKIFSLKARYKTEVRQILKAKNHSGKIISVHLRRRDYKTFIGGLFYFTNQEYSDQIRRISKRLNQKVPPLFILICEEPLDLVEFDSPNILYFGPSSIGFDQALMQMSDFILGPSSTFNAWPSFLNGTARAEIQKKDGCVILTDFHRTTCNYIPGFDEGNSMIPVP